MRNFGRLEGMCLNFAWSFAIVRQPVSLWCAYSA